MTVKESQQRKSTHFLWSTERGTRQDANESQRARCTHELSSKNGSTSHDRERKRANESLTNCRAGGRTIQNSERKPEDEGHSRPVESKGGHQSGQQRGSNEQEALTLYRAKREQVRKMKEGQRARGTHQLSSTEGNFKTIKQSQRGDTHVLLSTDGGTSQYSKTKPGSDGHSRPGKRT
jgi:hypothetical protein